MTLDLDERTDSTAVDAMEAAATPPRPPKVEPKPPPVRAFCWACGDTHSDTDICIPRTE